MDKTYSDYTAEKWPWKRKRSPSAELSSIFKDQASLKGAAKKKGEGDGQAEAKQHKPGHVRLRPEEGL
jgi:hypothetical protein